MSGPKCSEWDVQENRRRLEAARLSALAEVSALADEVASLRKAVAAISSGFNASTSADVPIPRMERSASTASSEQAIAVLRAERTRLLGERARFTAAAHLADAIAASTAAHQRRVAQKKTEETVRLAVEAEARAASAQRIASRAPEGLSQGEMGQLGSKTQAYIAATAPGAIQELEFELRMLVQQFQSRQETRIKDRARACVMKDAIRGLENGELQRLRTELEDVESGARALDDGLAKRVSAATERARKASDLEYARDVLRGEFEALGYQVGEEFSTAFMQGGQLSLSKGDSAAYAVQVSFDPNGRQLDTRLIRTVESESSAQEIRLLDKEAETSWCGDYARILAGAAKQKVIARLTRRVAPGVEAVPLVVAAGKARARESRAAAPRTMTTGKS
jgi:hypothetical protein